VYGYTGESDPVGKFEGSLLSKLLAAHVHYVLFTALACYLAENKILYRLVYVSRYNPFGFQVRSAQF
jgi:hypothetical protein